MRKEIKPPSGITAFSDLDLDVSRTYLYQLVQDVVHKCFGGPVSYKPSRLQRTWHENCVLDQDEWFYTDLTEASTAVVNAIKANCLPKPVFQAQLKHLLSQGEANGPRPFTYLQGPIVLPGLDLTSLTACAFEVYLQVSFKPEGMVYSPDEIDELLTYLTRSQPHTASSLLVALQTLFDAPGLHPVDLALDSYVSVEALNVCVIQTSSLEEGTYSTLVDNLTDTTRPAFHASLASLTRLSSQAGGSFDEDQDGLSNESLNSPGLREDFDVPNATAGYVPDHKVDREVKPAFTLVTSGSPNLRAFSTLTPVPTTSDKKDEDEND